MKDSYEQDARILIERLCFGSLEWDAEATKRAIHRTTALVEGQRAALKDAQQRIDGLEDLVEHINATNELMKKALTGVLQSAGYESGENSSGHKQMMVSLWAIDKAREALSKCEA